MRLRACIALLLLLSACTTTPPSPTQPAALGVGLCVLVAPELVVGAIIVTGVVVVGFAINEALEAYEKKRGRPQVVSVTGCKR